LFEHDLFATPASQPGFSKFVRRSRIRINEPGEVPGTSKPMIAARRFRSEAGENEAAACRNCVDTTINNSLAQMMASHGSADCSGETIRYDRAMYRAVTRQIEVTVEPNFAPEQSSAERYPYFWSYTIVITNTGEETVQLRSRHWIITDATGRQEEVRGEGVVGEQPVLAPGERFEYTSGVPLSTASGFMTGRYQMVNESGETFEIEVPTFSLDSPDTRRVLN
jgi:ApaG protein